MIDLIKVIASEHFMEIIDFVKANPERNSSSIAKALDLHILTVQRSLDTVERYGFVEARVERKPGRPAKVYRYLGGEFKIDLDRLLGEYELRGRLLRETGKSDISFSFDVDRELVNAVLIGGKNGEKVRLDEKAGRFLWLVPPPDSGGETIQALAEKAGISIIDAIRFVEEMRGLGVVEMLP
jgi:DNA-binding transcriptional ArsR family regulator